MRRNKNMSDPRAKGQRRPQPAELDGDYTEQYYYEEEEPGGITLRTLKRAGRYMWIGIVFFLISLALIGGYIVLYNSSIVNEKRSCWVEEQNIELLAQKYVTDNGFSSLPAYIEDIPGFENVYKECPTGGAYTWNPITGEYSCSEHGHWPEGFNQAQSINQGTTSVMVEVD